MNDADGADARTANDDGMPTEEAAKAHDRKLQMAEKKHHEEHSKAMARDRYTDQTREARHKRSLEQSTKQAQETVVKDRLKAAAQRRHMKEEDEKSAHAEKRLAHEMHVKIKQRDMQLKIEEVEKRQIQQREEGEKAEWKRRRKDFEEKTKMERAEIAEKREASKEAEQKKRG